MMPELSSLITKKGATSIGLPSTVVIIIWVMAMHSGGEYSVTNHLDDTESIKDNLEELKKDAKKTKKELKTLTEIICSNPEFTCTK